MFPILSDLKPLQWRMPYRWVLGSILTSPLGPLHNSFPQTFPSRLQVACIEVPSYSGELNLVLLARLHLRAHTYPETKPPLWTLILDRPKAAFVL
ncbi:hypothetical protein CEP54_000993 [Fusarium duplospermum]|uniref:Uncharacterized protein n=1 Tax=Fusarium duplospermum TaxID=1325734 RepID=A0A428R2Z5_9HYPO|nr:hypothetical protein CEP54_000993 [Fusarium duplospermum]